MAGQADRTVNKVAMCGALVAGFAYVGYKVVKNFKNCKGGNRQNGNALLDYEEHKRGRIYLRRLSGSECSALAEDVLFGNELNDKKESRAKMFFRPLSVQERIRELNLRARHFAETVLAVQLYDGVSGPPQSQANSISLQPSPTHGGPRLFTPIEITKLGSSRCSSFENLSFSNGSLPKTGSSTSLVSLEDDRRSLRSFRRRNPSSQSISKEEFDQTIEYEGERMLDERESELKRRLQGFEDGTTKILTPYEAKSLVALLHTNDCDILERALVTVSNYSAFSTNQDSLRDAGCILRLQHLINHPDRAVKVAATSATANLALNTENQQCMEKVVPSLLVNLDEPYIRDSELLGQTLLTLTNVAALNNWHSQFMTGIGKLWNLTESEDPKIRVLCLRLLINLSTNDSMITHLMSPSVPSSIWNLLDIGTPEPELLRAVTLMVNIVSANKRKPSNGNGNHVTQRRSLKIYGLEDKDQCVFLPRVAKLMLSHPNEDIRQKSRNLLNLLKGD